MEQSQPQWKVGQSMNNKVETTGHMDLNNVSNIEYCGSKLEVKLLIVFK